MVLSYVLVLCCINSFDLFSFNLHLVLPYRLVLFRSIYLIFIQSHAGLANCKNSFVLCVDEFFRVETLLMGRKDPLGLIPGDSTFVQLLQVERVTCSRQGLRARMTRPVETPPWSSGLTSEWNREWTGGRTGLMTECPWLGEFRDWGVLFNN
jgi:hypothetical protein